MVRLSWMSLPSLAASGKPQPAMSDLKRKQYESADLKDAVVDSSAALVSSRFFL